MWLDQNKTLLLNRNSDTWQLPVENSLGDYLGNVVAQIVEPQEFLVRYFLVYNPIKNRKFLVPSDTVISIDERICSTINSTQSSRLPEYEQSLERDDEEKIYDIIAQTPYWETHHP